VCFKTAPKRNVVICERRRFNQEEKRKIREEREDKKSTQTTVSLFYINTYVHMQAPKASRKKKKKQQ